MPRLSAPLPAQPAPAEPRRERKSAASEDAYASGGGGGGGGCIETGVTSAVPGLAPGGGGGNADGRSRHDGRGVGLLETLRAGGDASLEPFDADPLSRAESHKKLYGQAATEQEHAFYG